MGQQKIKKFGQPGNKKENKFDKPKKNLINLKKSLINRAKKEKKV